MPLVAETATAIFDPMLAIVHLHRQIDGHQRVPWQQHIHADTYIETRRVYSVVVKQVARSVNNDER